MRRRRPIGLRVGARYHFTGLGGELARIGRGLGGGGGEGGRVDVLSGASDPCRAQCRRRRRFCKCINLLSYAGESEQC